MKWQFVSKINPTIIHEVETNSRKEAWTWLSKKFQIPKVALLPVYHLYRLERKTPGRKPFSFMDKEDDE